VAPKKAKRGRKSSYDEKIAPYLDVIRTMARAGVPQSRMREMLGVSRSAWDRCKASNTDFLEALTPQIYQGGTENAPEPVDRAQEIKELEAAMMQIAKGFEREQTRYFSTKEGLEEVTETTYYPPNFQALRFLLLNWAGYMSEPAAQAQREKEFAHKKAMDEKNNW
jgi:hypothetical protein